jgi:hypothetical protein
MIVGRVDGMNNGKVYGWAFNADSPDEHIEIKVSRGSAVLASGRADRFRKDLPEAGIGKGDHAFEIVLPPGISSVRGILAVACSATAGDAALPVATNDDRRVDDLFQIFSRRYDEVLVAFKAELDDLRRAGQPSPGRNAELPPELVGRLFRLERRMDDIEVFVVRLDELGKRLQERIDIAGSPGIFSSLFRKRK